MDITTIERLANDDKHLVHASNIVAKLHSPKLDAGQKRVLDIVVQAYNHYISSNLGLIGFTEEIVRQRVGLLNEYYNTFHPYYNTFSSQGKLRSTILEEFLYLLFKDLVDYYKRQFDDTEDVLKLGSVKAFSNFFVHTPGIKAFIHSACVNVNLKDQDFAIYRPLDININGKKYTINIPALAVEVKTYLDKTMYEGAVATAEKIKTGNPFTKFFVVTETYDVSFDVDPSYSRIDQIFVLRKSKRMREGTPPPISERTVLTLMRLAREHFERAWADLKAKMEEEGILI